MKKCPVIHFEMPAKDSKRVMTFYSKVFGWEMNQMGEEMGNYILASTTDTEDGMATTPGAINGGFWETQDKQPPHLVISVDDIQDHMKQVNDAGGKIIDGPMDISGIGTFAMCEDTEGNKIGMLQPASMEK